MCKRLAYAPCERWAFRGAYLTKFRHLSFLMLGDMTSCEYEELGTLLGGARRVKARRGETEKPRLNYTWVTLVLHREAFDCFS